jgi:hypothetical protein
MFGKRCLIFFKKEIPKQKREILVFQEILSLLEKLV